MAKLSARDPNVGHLICTQNGEGIHDPTKEHVLYISPSGGGKTIIGVVGPIFHLAKLGYSQVINDCKPEIAFIVKDALEKEIGCEVVINNPLRVEGLPHHDSNPLQLLIDDYARSEQRRNMIHDALNIALQLRPEPSEADKNEWVRQGARDILITVASGLAALTPESCTLTRMLKIITRTDELVRFLTALSTQEDLLSGDLADKAHDLLSTRSNTQEHFEYYRKSALNSLSSFASSGHLGNVGSSNDYRYERLRDEQQAPLIIINVCPLEHLEVFKSYFELMNYTCFQTLKRHSKGRRVAMILDEFTNFKIDLASNLTALRSLRVRCFLYAQSESEIARVYGDKMLTTIKDQCRVKVYFGIKDLNVAKALSEMLGSGTVNTESHNIQNDPGSESEGSLSVGKMGKPLMTPNDILTMGRSEVIAFIDNKIVFGKKITYAEVWPWCEWAGSNPIEGGKLPGDVKLKIAYPDKLKAVRGSDRSTLKSLLSFSKGKAVNHE